MSKTLEDLGYEEVIDCAGIHYFKGDKVIEFYEEKREFGCYNAINTGRPEYFDMEELKAIYQYCIDNKWI